MDSNGKFWVSITAIFAVMFFIVVGGAYRYNTAKNAFISNAITEGSEPIAARCAFDDYRGRDAICVIYATTLK